MAASKDPVHYCPECRLVVSPDPRSGIARCPRCRTYVVPKIAPPGTKTRVTVDPHFYHDPPPPGGVRE